MACKKGVEDKWIFSLRVVICTCNCVYRMLSFGSGNNFFFVFTLRCNHFSLLFLSITFFPFHLISFPITFLMIGFKVVQRLK